RSEDVVHVVMTDHAIPRRPPDGDPLAPLRERLGPRYRGEVQPYYPATLPDTAEVRLTIALAQVTDDSNTAAGALRLREAIERMNSPPVKALVELARAYGRLSQHSEAARWFAAAIERRPADSGPRVAFGRWLLASGDAHAAVEQLRSARHIEPASPRIAADLGTALVMAKNPAEAAIVLQDAVRRHPDLAVAHNGLGLAYQGTGRVAQAISAFREAIRVQPDYSEAWVNLGIALAGSGHRPEARAAFERALHHDPRSAGAHHNYGLLLMESGDRNRAEEHFRTAFELDPSSDASRVSLAFLLLAKDRHAEAVALLETVIQRTPDFAQARLYLGVALAAQGKTAAARAHLHRAASSEDPAVRRAAEQHLRQTR
ncbi:MAG TPA: tetratricopeptide repeat protein, partial [Bryobacteraceae bacterium]|nr:tetratricopeptide repeat protein [Bryobacteraceae bacterium]